MLLQDVGSCRGVTWGLARSRGSKGNDNKAGEKFWESECERKQKQRRQRSFRDIARRNTSSRDTEAPLPEVRQGWLTIMQKQRSCSETRWKRGSEGSDHAGRRCVEAQQQGHVVRLPPAHAP